MTKKMITHHEKWNIVDVFDKPTGLTLEVNWKPEEEKTNQCKVLKLTFPDGSEHFMKREHLHSILFAISDEDEQRKMIPLKQTKVRWYETVLSVQAKQNIHKGESITFPIKISLPAEGKETIGEVKTKSKYSPSITLP